MDLFDRYDGKKSGDIEKIEMAMQCLSDYDAIALLDDFDHIRSTERE